jgi:hypothetical protein
MIDKENLFRLALDQPRHPLAMARPQHESLQNEQVQRSLQQGDTGIGILSGRHPTQVSHRSGGMST